ncbi:hypothetical protein THIOKS12580020 [Thiocapsa sp. KS1]|nr:hypothetical protein THIOKS12580020 [Thiocapsa sp. KS1]
MQVVKLRQLEQLLDLIGLRLAFQILQIQQFRNLRMNENMMASVHSVQSEAESLSYRYCFQKPHILGAGEKFEEQLALFHESKTNPASRRLLFVWSRTSGVKRRAPLMTWRTGSTSVARARS